MQKYDHKQVLLLDTNHHHYTKHTNCSIQHFNIIKNYMKTNLITTETSFTTAFLKKLNTFKTLDIKNLKNCNHQ